MAPPTAFEPKDIFVTFTDPHVGHFGTFLGVENVVDGFSTYLICGVLSVTGTL